MVGINWPGRQTQTYPAGYLAFIDSLLINGIS